MRKTKYKRTIIQVFGINYRIMPSFHCLAIYVYLNPGTKKMCYKRCSAYIIHLQSECYMLHFTLKSINEHFFYFLYPLPVFFKSISFVFLNDLEFSLFLRPTELSVTNPSTLTLDDAKEEGKPLVLNCNADIVGLSSKITSVLKLSISRQIHGRSDVEFVVSSNSYYLNGRKERKFVSYIDFFFSFWQLFFPLWFGLMQLVLFKEQVK